MRVILCVTSWPRELQKTRSKTCDLMLIQSVSFFFFLLVFPAEITLLSLTTAQWVLCSGSRNRQARLRTSGIISQDQPGINHPTLAHVQVITLYTTLHAKQAAVTTCRKARAKKKKKKKRKSAGRGRERR